MRWAPHIMNHPRPPSGFGMPATASILDAAQRHDTGNGHSRPERAMPSALAAGRPMETDLTTRILNDPKYQELKSKRSRFGWWLTLAMMVVYYGFILLVAFDKPLLATRLGSGVTTVGMP